MGSLRVSAERLVASERWRETKKSAFCCPVMVKQRKCGWCNENDEQTGVSSIESQYR